jgi:uncharacterized protein (DUF433 family)
MRSAITLKKSVLGGRPTIAGTRIGVHHIASYVAAGLKVTDIKAAYPQLTNDQIIAALNYLHDQASRQIQTLEKATV